MNCNSSRSPGVRSAIIGTFSQLGNSFAYARKQSPQRLLHMPLDREVANLDPAHQLFTANRSMRDVEPSVILKVRDPRGHPIANADDL